MSVARIDPCPCGHDRSLWVEVKTKDGLFRTTCKKCGKWIGNRTSKDAPAPKDPHAKP